MIERHAVVVHNVAVTMAPTVAAEAAAAAWAVLAAVVVSAEEEGAFEEVVAGANGTVGRFRSEGDFPDALAAGSHGEASGTSLLLLRLRPSAFLSLKRRSIDKVYGTNSVNKPAWEDGAVSIHPEMFVQVCASDFSVRNLDRHGKVDGLGSI